MLYDLANGGGYVAHKWASEDREVWRHRERMSKTCCTAEKTVGGGDGCCRVLTCS